MQYAFNDYGKHVLSYAILSIYFFPNSHDRLMLHNAIGGENVLRPFPKAKKAKNLTSNA